MFSATMAPKSEALLNKCCMNRKLLILQFQNLLRELCSKTYVVYDGQKEKLLKEILKNEDFSSVIIFIY